MVIAGWPTAFSGGWDARTGQDVVTSATRSGPVLNLNPRARKGRILFSR
jgi:hypothetical protein